MLLIKHMFKQEEKTMANASYMSIKDDKGNDIKGSVDIGGREGTIEVVALEGNVAIPVDPETNEARGVRKHDGFKVTAVVDKATPNFYKALSDAKRWQQVTIDSYAPDETGDEKKTYTIQMENVAVVGTRQVKLNVKDPELKTMPDMVEVTFRYPKITHTWVDGNITATDDWKASRASAA